MKRHILALCGFANAGKDTAADVLVARTGFHKLAFADALKAELSDAFHVALVVFTRRECKSQPMEELALTRCLDPGYVGAVMKHLVTRPGATPNVYEELQKPRTPRETMQLWGTQYRRAQDPDYWVKLARSRMNFDARQFGQTRFVITDCRFDNEVDALRSMGARLWQIKRPGLDAGTTTEGTHTSATEGSSWKLDAVINNAHDVRHLQQLVLAEWWAMETGYERLKVEIPA